MVGRKDQWPGIDPDLCASCGYDKVFHQVGTGNGVPVGKPFCDDRHAAKCSCTGFMRVIPYSDTFSLSRADVERYWPSPRRSLLDSLGIPYFPHTKEPKMKLSDFKPGDLVYARSNSFNPWWKGTVSKVCSMLIGLTPQGAK